MLKNKLKLKGKYLELLIDSKFLIIFPLLLILTLIVFILSISIGTQSLSYKNIILALLDLGERSDKLIVTTFRVPRALVSFFVGASLGIAGAIMQSVVRNPLASPNILGIVPGAAVGSLLFLTLFLQDNSSTTINIIYMPLFSFIVAFSVALIVYFSALKGGELLPSRLILIGIAVSGIFSAIRQILILEGPIIFIRIANDWIIGSIYGANWRDVQILLIWFIILVIITLPFIRYLNLILLEDKLSHSLGLNVEKAKFILLMLSTAYTAVAVSIAGGIGFVGLVAPHIARKILNTNLGNVIPLSALIGALIVMTADIFARVAFSPLEVPAGIFTALVGAPFFIFLLIKSRARLN